MGQDILLRGAKQVLTLRGSSGVRRGTALQDLGIIEDGSVLIRDGIIAEVGTTRRVENLKEARQALEIPVSGRVIMPGFVDASLSLSADDGHSSHKHKRIRDFNEETIALLRSCLQHGTLAAEVKANADAKDFHSDISVLRKLAHIGSNPVRMIRTWRIADRSQAMQGGRNDFCATFELLTRRKLIRFVEVTRESEQNLNAGVLALAKQARIGIKLLWSGGSTDLLSSLLTRLQPSAICCLPSLTATEAAVLSQSSCTMVLATGKEVFEGPNQALGRRLADGGGAIALSSGYESASAATFSMQMSLSLAVVRLGLTAEEAFTAATINAAHAAGCAHLTGSLETGKQADLLLLNVPDYREVPRQFGINHVEMAIRQGNIVLNRTRWKVTAT